MAGLRDLNSKFDYFWNEYSKRFPAFCYIDENGNKSKPLIVPGQTLRRDAPMYMKRLVDEDPTSYYFMMQANPLKGPADRLTAVEFFFDFFQMKLGMRSSFQDQGMDPIQAADAEVLPAPKDDLYKRYYDEQIKAAEAQQAAEKKAADDQAFKDKFGFDRNDPDIIDIDVDAGNGDNAGRDIQARDAKAGAVALPKNIFYAVDMHIPAGMELGYDGRGANRMGGRRNGRLGHGGYGRLGFESEELKEAVTPVSNDDVTVLTPKDIGKKIAGMFDNGRIDLSSKVLVRIGTSTYGIHKVQTSSQPGYKMMRICSGPKPEAVTVQQMLDEAKSGKIYKFSELTEFFAWIDNKRCDIIQVMDYAGSLLFLVEDVIGKRNAAYQKKRYRSMFDSEIDEALVQYDTQVEPGFDKESRTTFKQYDVEYLYERRGIVSDGTESEYISANSLLDLIRQVNRAIRSEIGPDAKLAEFVRVVDLSTDRDVTDQVNKRITQVIGESEEEGSGEETSKLTAGSLQKKIKDFETESEKKNFAVTVKLPDGTEAEDVTAEVEEGKVTIVCPAAEEEPTEDDAEEETPEEEPVEDAGEEPAEPEEDDAEESDPVNESISQDYADYCRTLIAD